MLKTLLLPNAINPTYWKRMGGEAKLVFSLLKDSRVPIYMKAIPILVIVYLLSPLDLVPGFLPVVGQMDDFALLLLGLKAFTRLVPDEVMRDYLPASAAA